MEFPTNHDWQLSQIKPVDVNFCLIDKTVLPCLQKNPREISNQIPYPVPPCLHLHLRSLELDTHPLPSEYVYPEIFS